MGRNQKSIRLATRFFIMNHGCEMLRMLLTEFTKRESRQSIAEKFHMSTRSVLHWKNTFGIVTKVYTIFPEGFGDASKKRDKVRERFVLRYSMERYSRLMEGFFKGESEQLLADEFNVSRRFVLQWKNTFGTMTTKYTIFPEVIDELNKGGGDPEQSIA